MDCAYFISVSTSKNNRRLAGALLQHLKDSEIFRDYAKAFTEFTGLTLALRAVDSSIGALHEASAGLPDCSAVAPANECSGANPARRRRGKELAGLQPDIFKYLASHRDVVVPIRVGETVVAFLQAGRVLLRRPSRQEFRKATRAFSRSGARVNIKRLERACFQVRVLKPRQYVALLRLLDIFGRHLAAVGSQIMLTNQNLASPMITKAMLYITEHRGEQITLRQVARVVGASASHFCNVFKRETGLTFTEYRARVRIEEAKKLLRNPHQRISEAAFGAGFQSLS